MGGDAFEATEKLTHDEYTEIVAELITALTPICLKIEPYIPLPEKELHGDVDMLLILKPDKSLIDIVSTLKIERHILNNNDTINSVYRNKQVDFKRVQDEEQFKLVRFYKSYSGIGAFLGGLIPSKDVKLTDLGLICMHRQGCLKLEHRVCNDVRAILDFYGLDHEVYQAGFTRRANLFEFMRRCRFLDEKKYGGRALKNATKLMFFFREYLLNSQMKAAHDPITFQDALGETLAHFKCKEQFEKAIEEMVARDKAKKDLSSKFNATHMMKAYGVEPKQINNLKQTFAKHFPSKQHHQKYILDTDLAQIIQLFGEVCELQAKKTE